MELMKGLVSKWDSFQMGASNEHGVIAEIAPGSARVECLAYLMGLFARSAASTSRAFKGSTKVLSSTFALSQIIVALTYGPE